MNNIYTEDRVAEYRFDKDFTLKSQMVYELKNKLKAMYNRAENKSDNKWLPFFKEYNVLKTFEYQGKILVEDNLFELMELFEVMRLFSNNNMDTKADCIINEWEIKLNENTRPFSLTFANEQYMFYLTRSQCSITVPKLQKIIQQLEPFPSSIKKTTKE